MCRFARIFCVIRTREWCCVCKERGHLLWRPPSGWLWLHVIQWSVCGRQCHYYDEWWDNKDRRERAEREFTHTLKEQISANNSTNNSDGGGNWKKLFTQLYLQFKIYIYTCISCNTCNCLSLSLYSLTLRRCDYVLEILILNQIL